MPSFKIAVLLLLTSELTSVLQNSTITANAIEIDQSSRSSFSNTRKMNRVPKSKKPNSKKENKRYEIWASDQSNSVPGETSTGVNGSYLWIWDSESIDSQLKQKGDASPLSCTPDATTGPCDLFDVFPRALKEMNTDGATGKVLGDMPKFGRLHGMLRDPQNRYMTTSMYAPGMLRLYIYIE